MRSRSETIGSLGRSPARQSKQPENAPPTRPPSLGSDPPPPERGVVARWIHGALFDNMGLKFLSLVLAVTVFLLINTDKDREITVRVGVKYEVPADKVLTSEPLEEVKVTLRGPWRRLRQFDERELGRIDLDLRNAPTTGDIAITHDMIANLPPGLEVLSISPRSVRVAFDRRGEKLVEVTPAVAGRPQHGYVVAEVKASPATIKVRGGERLLAALTAMKTMEVSLEYRTDSFEQLAEVVVPEGVDIDPTQRISVHVRIVEELVTKKIPDLAVAIRGDGDPTKWAISPGQVEVTLTGALLAVEKARDVVRPVVKITATDTKARDADIVVDGLPPGVGVRISPERVRVSPVK